VRHIPIDDDQWRYRAKQQLRLRDRYEGQRDGHDSHRAPRDHPEGLGAINLVDIVQVRECEQSTHGCFRASFGT
jgi:hypothetical protein